MNYSGFFLTCPSTSTCYAEGDVGNQAEVEVTQDGGVSWHESALAAHVDPPFTCVDASTCAALASDGSGGAVFVETIDAGQSWISLPFPGQVSSALSCTTATSCVAIALNNDGLDSAMVTADGGHTWSQFELPSQFQPPSGFTAAGLECSSAGTCTALGNMASADYKAAGLYGTDGGSSWAPATVPSGFSTGYDFSCGDATNCMAVGTTPSSYSVVIVSTDGGQVWSEASSPPGPAKAEFLNWISCPTSSSCWVTGGGLPSTQGTSGNPVAAADAHAFVAETTDLGQSWQFAQLPAGVDAVGNLSCPDATTCYALGAQKQPSGVNSLVLLSDGG